MANMLRILKETLKKEKLMSSTNILVLTITFLLLSFFIYIVIFSQTTLKYLEQQAQVTLFFKDDFTEDNIQRFVGDLKVDKRVSDVRYVSKNEAMVIFKDINKNEPILLESLTSNILPASVEVKTKNLSDLNIIANDYGRKDSIEEVRFFSDVVNKFKLWSTVVYVLGFILVSLFLVISYSVILSTLRMVIHSRGSELEIIKLVGASDSYIRDPFVYQGLFFGLVSSLAAGIVSILIGFTVWKSNLFPQGLSLGFVPGFFINPLVFSVILTILLLASGCALGYLGSSFAVKKYLKY